MSITDDLRKYMSWPNDFSVITEMEFKKLMRAYDKLQSTNAALVKQRDDFEKYIHEIRPYADCYKRVCQSLGIEKDISGHVKNLKEQRDDLKEALETAKRVIKSLHGLNSIKPDMDWEDFEEKSIEMKEIEAALAKCKEQE